MRVLVLGGAGYIGSHVCLALAQAGHEPVTVDNLSTGHQWAVQWGPLHVQDIADTPALTALIAQIAPDAAIHLAASLQVAESVADPLRYWRNNVGGTVSLVQAARDAGLRRLVFSSTAAVYGEPPAGRPIAEDDPIAPVNPYGLTKVAAEQVFTTAAQAHGLDVVLLRYFNAAGADPQTRIGEAHEPETHLIPIILQAALGQRPQVQVFGTDWPSIDGTPVRDFIHVMDLAAAHVAAVERLVARPQATGVVEAINLGAGTATTVGAMIAAARAVTGCEIPVTAGPRRAGDPFMLVADNTRARALLDWTPQRSDIATILTDAWAWARSPLGRQRRVG